MEKKWKQEYKDCVTVSNCNGHILRVSVNIKRVSQPRENITRLCHGFKFQQSYIGTKRYIPTILFCAQSVMYVYNIPCPGPFVIFCLSFSLFSYFFQLFHYLKCVLAFFYWLSNMRRNIDEIRDFYGDWWMNKIRSPDLITRKRCIFFLLNLPLCSLNFFK